MSFFSRDRLLRLLILLVPIGGLLTYLGATEWFYHLPFYIDYDPEMAYFFSSLSFLNGTPIAYIDHPGTPVQMLGGLLFWLTAPFLRLGGEDLVRYHTQNPALFLGMAHTTILLLNLGAVAVVGSIFFKGRGVSGHLLAAALTALFFIANPMDIYLSSVFTHNAFNFFGGSLLLALVYRVVRRGGTPRLRDVALYSFAAGVLTAVTIYFATWALGILLAFALWALFAHQGRLRAISIALLSGGCSLLGFFTATLPILGSYPRLFQWILDLATHKGFYGSGEVGMVPLGTLLLTIYGLLKQSPIFTVFILVTALVLYAGYRLQKMPGQANKVNAGRSAFLLAMILQLLATIFVVAKHPQMSYFVSAAAILIPLLGAALESVMDIRAVPTWAALLAALLILGIFGNSIYANILGRRWSGDQIAVGEAAVSAQLDQVGLERGVRKEELKVLRGYHVFDPCLAILNGDGNNRYQWGPYLGGNCSHNGSLEMATGKATYGEGSAPLSQMNWDVVLIREIYQEQFAYLSNPTSYRIIKTKIDFNGGNLGNTLLIVHTP